MIEKVLLKKLVREAVAEAMSGINGRIETLTDSVNALRRAVLQDEKELSDRDFHAIRSILENMPPVSAGVKAITICIKEEE